MTTLITYPDANHSVTTKSEYDELNRKKNESSVDGSIKHTTTYSHEFTDGGNGFYYHSLKTTQPKTAADPANGFAAAASLITVQLYDRLDREISLEKQANHAKNFTVYDAVGNPQVSVDPVGRQTRFIYDARNRKVQTLRPDGSFERSLYNGASEVVQTETASNFVYGYRSDPTNRTSIAYNALGLPETVIDPEGQKTDTKYSQFNEPFRIRFYAHSTDGSPTTTTLRSFDAQGRIVESRGDDRVYVKTDYDANGNVIRSARFALNAASAMQYDEGTGAFKNPTGASSDQRSEISVFDQADRLRFKADGGRTTTAKTTANSKTVKISLANHGLRDTDRILLRLVSSSSDIKTGAYAATVIDRDQFSIELPQNATATQTLSVTVAQSVHETKYDNAGRTTAEVDPRGYSTTFSYDNFGRLAKKQQPKDSDNRDIVTQYVYLDDNRIRAQYDPKQSAKSTGKLAVKYEYDDAASKVKQINPDGTTIITKSNLAGETDWVQNARSNSTVYAHDDLGRVIQATAPTVAQGTPVTRHQFDQAGNEVLTSTPAGNDAIEVFDGLGRALITQSFAVNTNQSAVTISGRSLKVYGRNDVGVKFSTTAAHGFNSNDYIEFTIGVRRAVYPVVKRSNTEFEVRWTADSEYPVDLAFLLSGSMPVAQLMKLSSESRSEYEANNLKISTNGRGYKTRFTYDLAGRQVGAYVKNGGGVPDVSAANRLWSKNYDDFGQLITQVTEGQSTTPGIVQSRTTTFNYDALGRVVETIGQDPDGAGTRKSEITRTVYDQAGNTVGSINTLSASQLNGTAVSASFFSTTLESLLDTHKNTTTWTYDKLGRRVRETKPDADPTSDDKVSPVTRWKYDQNGNVTDQYDGDTSDVSANHVIRTYDDMNYLRTEKTNAYTDDADTPSEVTRTYDYYATGSLKSVLDRDNRKVFYERDALEEATQEKWYASASSSSPSDTLVFAYDLAGRNTFSSSAGGSGPNDYLMTFDGLGRITSDTQNLGTVSATVQPGYDLNGNRKNITAKLGTATDFTNYATYDYLDRPDNLLQSAGTTNKGVKFVYNLVGQPREIHRYAAGSVNGDSSITLSSEVIAAARSYEFDYLGQVLQIKNATTVESKYTYDAKNRVATFTPPSGATRTYSYDGDDQITGITGDQNQGWSYDNKFNRTARLNGSGVVAGSETVGADNRLISDGTWTYTYYGEGNVRTKVSSSGSWEFTYDHRNRLTQALQKTGSSQVQKIQFEYDARNRRTEKRVLDSSGAQTLAERYVYDGNDLVMVVNADSPTQVLARYLSDPSSETPLAEDTGGQSRWLITDAQGSVRKFYNNSTSSAYASPAGTLDYDNWGKTTNSSGVGTTARFRYTGQIQDTETGLLFYGARYYDPRNARFSSQDPAKDGTNLYSYVYNNPANLFDPTGLAAASSSGMSFGGSVTSSPFASSFDWNVGRYSFDGSTGYTHDLLAGMPTGVTSSLSFNRDAMTGTGAVSSSATTSSTEDTRTWRSVGEVVEYAKIKSGNSQMSWQAIVRADIEYYRTRGIRVLGDLPDLSENDDAARRAATWRFESITQEQAAFGNWYGSQPNVVQEQISEGMRKEGYLTSQYGESGFANWVMKPADRLFNPAWDGKGNISDVAVFQPLVFNRGSYVRPAYQPDITLRLGEMAVDYSNIRVYRVEMGVNSRVTIGENGGVVIEGNQTLFLNFGSKARAIHFLQQRLGQGMSDAAIKSFEVPDSVLTDLLKIAIPERLASSNPDAPIIVDTTKAPNQIGLRRPQIKDLRGQIVQGSGKIEK